MISLPVKFKKANEQSEKMADVLVAVEDVTLFAEKTTEADWGANTSEDDVDYTPPEPDAGDVVLTKATSLQVTGYETGGDTWYPVDNFINGDSTAQGFKVEQNSLELGDVEVYLRNTTGSADIINVRILNESGGEPGGTIGSTIQWSVPALFEGWHTFDFSSQDIVLDSNTQYYIQLHSQVLGANSVEAKFDNSDATYADGAKWSEVSSVWSEDTGDDFLFRLGLSVYNLDGYIKTDNIDIGKVPTATGEWAIEDIQTPENSYWAVDATTNKVYYIKSDGTKIAEFATSVFDVSGNATDTTGISYAANGTLWICDNNTNKIYNTEIDGTLISSFLTSVFDVAATNITGIAYAADGTLWVSDLVTDKIYNIEPNGTWISEFATSVFDVSATQPTDVSYSDNDTLWVVDANTGKAYSVGLDGTWVSEFSTPSSAPTGIDYAANGTLWLSDSAANRIYNTTTTGGVISSFATSAFDPAATFTRGVAQGISYALKYEAWHSTTGAFAGEEIYIGVIIDGQAITDLKRYWRVKARFTSNMIRDETPILQSIKADYTTFRKFNKVKDLGYEPLVDGISSLTSKVDFFKPSSIGKISVQIVMTPAISIWAYSDPLFNKIVRVKLGYVYPGLTEADYIQYFTGAIDDWDVDDGILNLQLKDLQKDWKLPVPEKWEDAADNVTYTNQHHTDIMLDIFQNEINVRDSGLLLDSFATVKTATPAYKVTRTITGKVEDAKKLVEELRVLLFAFFLPRGDGRIGLKLFDKTEATVASFNDDNTVSIKWRANSDGLINRTALYFNWNATGDDEESFSEYDPGDDSVSQADFRAIVPFKLLDKWTRTAEASQISDLETKILDQFDRMPSIVDIETDVKDIAVEAGDQVLVTTKEAPGGTGEGITDVRFLIVSKNLNFEGSSISFEALRVAI